VAASPGEVREAAGTEKERPDLTVEQILAWADAHHEATGKWPGTKSGPAHEAPFHVTWLTIDENLKTGRRGLPGGQSLRLVLAEHRGVPLVVRSETLSIAQILAWADAHHAAHGRWPSAHSGPIADAPTQTWMAIQTALSKGLRGLSGGTTLSRLLEQHRGVPPPGRRKLLSIEQILAWADAHQAVRGRWPNSETGPVDGLPGETWSRIDGSLRLGARGLPGGTTLVRLLAEHRGRQPPFRNPPLTVEQILAWADAHHAAHGRWPHASSGPIAGAPTQNWSTIDSALSKGHRGLSGGTSLSRLLAQHRRHRKRSALPGPAAD